MLPLSAAWTHEEGFPLETGIPRFWDSIVPISSKTGEDTVRSSTARYRPEASFNFRELHGHLTFHRQAREARVWVEAEGEAHRQGHQGFRGLSTPSHCRLSKQIIQLYRVRFCYLAYGQECYLILVHRILSSLHQL